MIFTVSKANILAEGKSAIDIAVEYLGMDVSKGYIGPKWRPEKEAYEFIGERVGRG